MTTQRWFDDLVPNSTNENAASQSGVFRSGAFEDLIPTEGRVKTNNSLANVDIWAGLSDSKMSSEQEQGQSRLWAGLPEVDPTKSRGFLENAGALVVESLDQAKANYAALLATGQWENLDEASREDLIELIARGSRPYDRPEELNAYYDAIGGEAQQVGDAWKKGNYGTAAIEALDFLGETLYEGITNPQGFGYATSEQAANLVGTWAPALAAARGGSLVGGAIGGPPGSAAGGAIGFFSGSTTGSYLVETGAQIREFIRARGGNPEDPQQVAAALRNPAVREDMLQRASTKGLSIAAWDAAANLLGIKLLKGAKGPTSTAVRGTAALGGQVLGAAGGEIQGQYLATGEVNPREVGLEVALELGPGGLGDVALSTYAARSKQVEPPIYDPQTATPDEVLAQEVDLSQTLDAVDAAEITSPVEASQPQDDLSAALQGIGPETFPSDAGQEPSFQTDRWFPEMEPDQRIIRLQEELKGVDQNPDYIDLNRAEVKASLRRALKDTKQQWAEIQSDSERMRRRDDALAAFAPDLSQSADSSDLEVESSPAQLESKIPPASVLQSMKIEDLRLLAGSSGISPFGKKSDLVDRLADARTGTSTLAQAFVDPRLSYPSYRENIRAFVEKNWEPGGGIAVIPAQGAQRTSDTGDINYDFNGETVRTSSVNPQWVQNLGQDISRKDLLSLIDRAAGGDGTLTERQQAIVSSVLDEMDGGVAGAFIPQDSASLEDLDARDRGIPPIETIPTPDIDDDVVDSGGLENDELQALTLGELREEAIARGLVGEVERLFESSRSDADLAASLYTLLRGEPAQASRSELSLKSYTEQDLTKQDERRLAQQKAANEQDLRIEADQARGQFSLTGSSLPADANPAQIDLVDSSRQIRVSPSVEQPKGGSASPADPSISASQEITDFGEKIGGARKDLWVDYAERMQAAESLEIAQEPLSKSWPAPDYQALIEEGQSPYQVAILRALRDRIPAKPRKGYKLNRWAEGVEAARTIAKEVISGALAEDDLRKISTTSQISDLVDLYVLVGHQKSLADVRISMGTYSVHKGIQYSPAKVIWTVEQKASANAYTNWPKILSEGSTREEALVAFKAKYSEFASPKKKNIEFGIYTKGKEKGFFVGRKVGRSPLLFAGPFETAKEARAYKNENHDALVDLYNQSREIPSERREKNEPRIGEDFRDGQNVTPDQFAEAFGFRGVEFGNWVENDRRQRDLNNAFDALMDMAAILEIPSKAISLNGELALAFGARGTGGKNSASAHYEPGKVVINLTKRSGAGSLGHEWWHALDNYFSRADGMPDKMMTTGSPDVARSVSGQAYTRNGSVRREMVDAFAEVVRTIQSTAIRARSMKLDDRRSNAYWTTGDEMSARAFEAYLIAKLQDQGASNDYLANIVSEKSWKASEALGFELEGSYPYPLDSEMPSIRAGFDRFFEILEVNETTAGAAFYEPDRLYNQTYERNIRKLRRRKSGPNLPAEQAALNFDPAPTVQNALEEARDQFHAQFRRLAAEKIKIGVERVTNAEEAAHVLAHIRRYGEERILALVLDEQGNILDLQKHTVGGKDSSPVYPEVLVPAIAAVDGAKRVYLAHNHPSGNPKASSADYTFTRNIKTWLDSADIEIAGHVVFGLGNSKSWYFKALSNDGEGQFVQIQPRLRKRNVEITERRITRLPEQDLPTLDQPMRARSYVAEVEAENAIVLLNNRHQVVGTLSMSADEMSRLREKNQVSRILRAVDTTNANAAIIKFQTGQDEPAANLVKFLSAHDRLLRVLDAFEVNPETNEVLSGAERKSASAARVADAYGSWFSRGNGRSESLSLDFVRSIADRFGQKNIGAQVGRIQVVGSEVELPQAVLEQAEQEGALGEILAVTYENEIFIVADRMESAAQIEEAILHESAHIGTRRLFGNQVGVAYQKLWLRMGGEKGIRALAEKGGFADRLEPYYRTVDRAVAAGKMSESDRRAFLVDEFIAHAQGAKAKKRLPEKILLAIREFIGYIRTALQNLGFQNISAFTDSDLAYLLRSIKNAAHGLSSRATDGMRARFMVAWHGTPHEVEAFSTDKIGTGEGNQIYGWGLYFSTRRRVGEWYRNKLTNAHKEVIEDLEQIGLVSEDFHTQQFADFIVANNGDILAAAEDYRERFRKAIEDETNIDHEIAASYDEKIQNYLEQGYIRIELSKGNLYQVDLAPQEDQYLLWDEPLSAQSESVRNALTQIDANLEGMRGSEIYGAISGTVEGVWKKDTDTGLIAGISGDKAASQYLRSIGIRGNKYLDGVSRYRSYREMRDEFLDLLSEDAGIEEVMSMVEAGRFSPSKERVLRALDQDDWLGFDYPAQAISAALRENLSLYDPSQELIDAIREERTGGTYNYVIFDDTDVEITARFARSSDTKRTQKKAEKNTTTVFIGRDENGNDITLQSSHPSLQDQNALKLWARKQFTKESLLGAETFERHVQTMGMKNADEIDLEFFVSGFLKSVRKAYGRRYEKLTAQQKAELNEALVGEQTSVPEPVLETISAMRTAVDAMSGKLQGVILDEIRYRLEALGEKQRRESLALIAKAVRAEQIEDEEWASIDSYIASKIRTYLTIQGNKGHYLNRSYQVFDDPEWAEKVRKDRALMENVRSFLGARIDPQGTMEEKLLTDQVEGLINLILREGSDAKDMISFMYSSQLGQKNLGILRMRKEIAPEIRALMGEYREPRVNFVRTMGKMSYLVANHHFLKGVRTDGLGVFLSKKPSGRMSTQVTAWDSNTMTPLAGLYATPEFAQALKDATTPFNSESWLRYYLLMNSSVKYGKTVLSPTTSARNFMSAFMFAVMNGHFNYGYALKAAAHTWSDLGVFGRNQKRREYLSELARLGVLHDNPFAGELKALLDEIADMDTLKGSKPVRWTKEFLNLMTKIYRAGDDFHKIVGFENEKASLMRTGLAEDKAKVMAADRIRNGYPTYSMVPEAIRTLRRFPLVGTFVSFPWEMIRTSIHQLRILREDAQMGRKAAVARRVVGMSVALSAAQAASMITMSLLGLDDEDDEAVRRIAAEWQRNAQILYLGFDENGMPQYLDLSHLDPYTYIKAPITALLNGNNESIDEKITDAVWSTLEPFLGTEITAAALMQVWANKNEYGGKIYNESADALTQNLEKLGYLFGLYPVTDRTGKLMPGVAYNIERTLKAALDKRSSSGRVYKLNDEFLAWVGFRFTTLDLKTAIKFRAVEFTDSKVDAGRPVRSVLTNPNVGGADRMLDAYEQTRLIWERNWRQMIASINAAKALGQSEREIAETLKASSVSERDIAFLIKGKVPDWMPSDSSLAAAREQLLYGAENRAEMNREFLARLRALKAAMKSPR